MLDYKFSLHEGGIDGFVREYNRSCLENIYSCLASYRYLLGYLEERILQIAYQLGLEDPSVSKKLNLDDNLCYIYAKTQTYQFYLTYSFQGKTSTKRIIEIPYLKENYTCIVNGILKLFANKLKRRNIRLVWENDTKLLKMISLENNYLSLSVGNDRVPIISGLYNCRLTDYLSSYLLESESASDVLKLLYGQVTTSKVEGYEKVSLRDGDLYVGKPLTGLKLSWPEKASEVEVGSFYILQKDYSILMSLAGLSSYGEVLTPENVVRLCQMIVDPNKESIYDSEMYVSRCFVTMGGLLLEHLEKTWLVNQPAKPLSEGLIKVNEALTTAYKINDLRQKFMQVISSSFTQPIDNINPIAELAHVRRFSLIYQGLLSKRGASFDLRSTSPAQLGRSCFISSTEGQYIGLIQHLALGSKFNELDELLVPYKKVDKNGALREKVYWLKPWEELNSYITDYESYLRKSEMVTARYNSSFTLIKRNDLDYVQIFSGQNMSLAVNLLVRANNSEIDRILTASNMIRQSMILKFPEAPALRSVFCSQLMPHTTGTLPVTKGDRVLYRSSTLTVVKEKSGNYKLHEYGSYRVNNYKTFLKQKLSSDPKYLLVPHSYDQEMICIGTVVRCAFMFYKGLNYEDSTVISSDLRDREKLNTLSVFVIKVPIKVYDKLVEKVTRRIINAYKYDLTQLDERGIIKVGSYVRKGDILVAKVRPITSNNQQPEAKLFEFLTQQQFNVRNNLFYLPDEYDKAFVLNVQVVKGTHKSNLVLQEEARVLRELNEKIRFIVLQLVRREIPNNLLGKGRERTDMCVDYLTGNCTLKHFNNSSLKERLKALLPNVKSLTQELLRVQNQSNLRFDKDANACHIEITLARDKLVQVGDKITGLHGNKAIISKIAQASDMPYSEDGEHAEILFSPLSVYGRLNYGQVVESRIMVLADSILEWLRAQWSRYGRLLTQERSDLLSSVKLLVERLGVRMSDQEVESWWGKVISSDELVLHDVPMSQIDKEKLSQIEQSIGKGETVTFRHGDTGAMLENPVHFGKVCLLKLIHTAESKFAARSLGDYSIKFNQPVRGKYSTNQNLLLSKGNAQKIGTMETTALIGRGMANCIYESFNLLNNSYSSIRLLTYDTPEEVRGRNLFSIARLYLQALGIDVQINKGVLNFSLLSQRRVMEISRGEVVNNETKHYKMKEAKAGGLYCEKIFGNDKNFACSCGKYVGSSFRGIKCNICGTTVESREVKSTWMGHINLCTPLVNQKIFRGQVYRLFPLSSVVMREIINLKRYVWVLGKDYGTLTTYKAFHEYDKVLSGGEAIQFLIDRIDLVGLTHQCLLDCVRLKGLGMVKKFEQEVEFLRFLLSFANGTNSLSSLIVRSVLVLPTSQRPLIMGSGGYSTVGSNTLYVALIRRNERLKRMLGQEYLMPVIASNKLMLQDSYNALLWNGVNMPNYTADPLVNAVKSKYGLFRQNVFSTRIDYSSRTIVSLNPNSPYGMVRLSYDAMKKIFLYHLHRALVNKGKAVNMLEAYRMLRDGLVSDSDVIAYLDEISRKVPILINRNPTLSVLGIQASYAVGVHGKVMEIPSEICAPMGADFDGDTMRQNVHLMPNAISEIREIFNQSIFNIADGKLVIVPNKEIGIGLYFLTYTEKPVTDKLPMVDLEELELWTDRVGVDAWIDLLLPWGTRSVTTLGRAVLAKTWWDNFATQAPDFLLSGPMTKSLLDKLVKLFKPCVYRPVEVLYYWHEMKDLGNRYATYRGVSFVSADLKPILNQELRESFESTVAGTVSSYQKGLINQSRMNQDLSSAWLTKILMSINDDSCMDEVLNHRKIIDSGYRGTVLNLLYLTSIRGFVTMDKDFAVPILSSLSSGYSDIESGVLSFTRKQLIVKSVGTWIGGYLNRRLIELLREIKVKTHDCDTTQYLTVDLQRVGHEQIYGRYLAEDIVTLQEGESVVIQSGQLIDKELYDKIVSSGVSKVGIRSPIFCQVRMGVCSRCYGYDFHSMEPVKLGTMVGINSAQGISEPITQMLIDSKHYRDIATSVEFEVRQCHATVDGRVSVESSRIVGDLNLDPEAKISQEGEFYNLPYGARLKVGHGDTVSANTLLYDRVMDGAVYAEEELDVERSVDHVTLRGDDGEDRSVPLHDNLWVTPKDRVSAGDVVVRLVTADVLDKRTLFANMNLFLENKPTGIYNIVADEDDSKVSVVGGSYQYSSRRGVVDLSIFPKHRIVLRKSYRKGEVIAIGSEGRDPHRYLEEGNFQKAVMMYIDTFFEVYRAVKVNVLLIHMEVFLSEFLGYCKTLDWNLTVQKFIQLGKGDNLMPVSRDIRNPHTIDRRNLLERLSYERLVYTLLDGVITGKVDDLRSVHSTIMCGKIPQIGKSYIEVS